MNVLFVGPLPEPITGQSVSCQLLLAELRKAHTVDVINLSKAGFRQGISSITRVAQVARILFEIWQKQHQADVIYFTISESVAGNVRDLVAYRLCGRRASRIVAHLHGGAGMREIMHGSRAWLRKLNARFVRRLGGMIVLGPSLTDIFDDVLPANRLFVVPNAAGDDVFASHEAIEKKFTRTTPLRVLFLTNLIPGKGHLELVAGLRLLEPSTSGRIEVDFAGGFASGSEQREFLAGIQGMPGVRYHGVVRDGARAKLLADAHVLCLPTYYAYEGQPLSILEAYASGCAVITTNHSGIPDIFTPDVNGYEVVKQSPQSIADVLTRAMANPTRLHEMAVANRRRADDHHRAAAHTAKLTDILRKTADRSG